MSAGPVEEVEDERLVGRTLCDRWRIVRLIGRGGMSVVYEARDESGSEVAVKVLNEALARQPRARERFLREGLVANRVGHPDAVHVLECRQTPDGQLLLVMELLEGQTLRKKCEAAGGRLELDEVLRVADRVLGLLEAAHAKGIFHRDIKPDNIFLTADCGVKVLDFGVAAVRDEAFRGASITQSGATLGTPAFMAPEQARGRQAQIDARTDVWALGATLFFCLTGRHVHEDALTANEALIFAATQRAPPFSRFRPDLGAISSVIDRALALAPADRWPSAQAMRLALQNAVAHPPNQELFSLAPLSDDTTLVGTIPEAVRTRRIGWPLAAAMTAVVVIAIGGRVLSQRSTFSSASASRTASDAGERATGTAPKPALARSAPALLPPIASAVENSRPPPSTTGLAPSGLASGVPAPESHVPQRGSTHTFHRASQPKSEREDVPESILNQRK